MISLPVVEASQVGAARRRAVQVADDLGLAREATDRLAIIVTEIATNLLRHAQEGEIVLVPSSGPERPHLTALGLDLGPGIGSLEAAFEDGFSTAADEAGIGGGLGAIRRLSDSFDVYTDAKGTTVISTLGDAPSEGGGDIAVRGLVVPKPGFATGGDAFAIRHEAASTLVMLVDVLGHGPAAAVEAQRASAAFETATGESLEEAEHIVDRALNGRRGAAALIVKIPHGGDTLEAIGLGNVRGEIVAPGGERRGIPCAPGIVGASGKRPRPTQHDWPGGAVLVLSTDGLRGAPRAPEPTPLFLRPPLTIAATVYKRRRRGSDDSGVLVARSAP